MFAILAILSIAIFIICAWFKFTPFYADLLKPLVVINFLGSLRQNLKDFLRDLYSSITILLTILSWIFIFSIVGFFLFRYTFEGAAYFVTLNESFWSMLILLTTANFPDVMLPAYYESYFYMAFFIVYLLIGLFFLLNLLLASVFIKFKERFERKITANEKRRRL